MMWCTHGSTDFKYKLPDGENWIAINVVGQKMEVLIKGNILNATLNQSPIYILSETRYQELTAF